MNGGSALRTCKMNLNAVDIAAFDYKDLIHITIDNVSTYWTVNKIVDYKPTQNVLTKVELLEWKESVDFGKRRNEGFGEARLGYQNNLESDPGDEIMQHDKSVILRNENDGVLLHNNSNNSSQGTGVALGRGVVANNNQTILGQYNDPNTTDIFQIGTGKGPGDRQTAFSISESGVVQIGEGDDIFVEEVDGTIHDLVIKTDPYSKTETIKEGVVTEHLVRADKDIEKLFADRLKNKNQINNKNGNRDYSI